MANKQKQQLMTETVHDFPKSLKITLVKLDHKTGEINANTFVPLVLFNRDRTVKLIKEVNDDTEKLLKVL